MLFRSQAAEQGISEREILYNVLFEMKKDINDLKKVIALLMQNANISSDYDKNKTSFSPATNFDAYQNRNDIAFHNHEEAHINEPIQVSEVVEENVSLEKKELEFMKEILKKHKGKRNRAAQELGISERTLYRKIRDYELENE